MRVRGGIWLGLAAVALLGGGVLGARSCAGSTRMETVSHYFLVRPGEELPSRAEMLVALDSSRRGVPIADGICAVRLPRPTRITWTGRREHELAVLSAPGDIQEVVLVAGERTVARERPEGGAARVQIVFEAPLLQPGRFRLDVRVRAGPLEPYEFELPGTFGVDPNGIGEWFGSPRARD